MNIVKYKYYITYNISSITYTKEVFPLGVDKIKIKDTKQDGRIFTRKELDGKLTFVDQPKISATDYSTFYQIDSNVDDKCGEISFEIKRSCDNGTTYETYWNGYFSTTDGTFDTDKCTFSVEIKPDDEYRCFMDGIDNEYNLSIVPTVNNGSATIVNNYEFWTCRAADCTGTLPSPAFNGDSSLIWLVFHTEILDGVTTTIYYRERVMVACQDGVAIAPDGDGWVQDTVNYDATCSGGLSKWVRTPTVVVTNNPNPDVAPGNCNAIPQRTPPHTQRLEVTKQAGLISPLIVGIYQQFDPTLCNNPTHCKWTYSVKYPKPNATYEWTITGIGNSIISGGYTSECITCFEVNGTLNVKETNSCGIANSATLAVSVGVPTRYNANVEIIGNDEICVGETCDYYINAQVGVNAFISATPCASINNTSTGHFSLTGISEGTFTVTFPSSGIDYGCTGQNAPVKTITVKKKGRIQSIYGLQNLCADDQSYYSVPNTNLTGFTWNVTGGSIVSGQGTNEILVQWDGSNGTGYVYVEETYNCGCAWYSLTSDLPDDESSCTYGERYYWCPDDAQVTIKKNTLFEEVLNSIKDKICVGLDVKSDFFEWDAPGDTPGYVPGINYVTGNDNQLNYLGFISARQMIFNITGDTDFANAELTEMFSWAKIEEVLREVFNSYWFIDNNGNLRVEHYNWFLRSVKYDLTDAYYHRYSAGKNIYSYDKTKAPKFERFKWQQAINTDFVGAEIAYAGSCIETSSRNNVKERGIPYITTDIIYLNILGIKASRDGFVLLCYDSEYTVQNELGKISQSLVVNGHLSWANLHYNYHRYNRVLLHGKMNLQETVFLSSLRYKKQVDVSFPYCCTDTLNTLEDLIITGVGTGVVDEAEHDFKTDMIKVTLLHDF